jgi:large subunit ribosomal protein L20
VRELGINYSRFIYGLNWSNLEINRKILCDLAINEPYSFKAVVDEVKIQGKLIVIINYNL